MKKTFKVLLGAAVLVTEVFALALPILTTSVKADGHPIQAITHAGFGGGSGSGGPVQTLRIEQAPLKIIAVDPNKKKEEPFKM